MEHSGDRPILCHVVVRIPVRRSKKSIFVQGLFVGGRCFEISVEYSGVFAYAYEFGHILWQKKNNNISPFFLD